jgi:hypothetical protein
MWRRIRVRPPWTPAPAGRRVRRELYDVEVVVLPLARVLSRGHEPRKCVTANAPSNVLLARVARRDYLAAGLDLDGESRAVRDSRMTQCVHWRRALPGRHSPMT